MRNAHKFPRTTARIWAGVRLDYRALHERGNRLSQRLLSQGLTKGERIGVLVHNSPQFVAPYFAAATPGAIFCPYNPHGPRAARQEGINASEPRVLGRDEEYGALVAAIRGELASVAQCISWQRPSAPWMGDDAALGSTGSAQELPAQLVEDAVIRIFFPAGTTGTPQGAVRPPRQLVTAARTGGIAWRGADDETGRISFPLAPIAGAANRVRHRSLPHTLVIPRAGAFTPDAVQRRIETEPSPRCQLVPTMLHALLQAPHIATSEGSRWRWIL